MRIQIPRQDLRRYLFCGQLAALHIPRHALRRARHLIAAPIVERDGQVHFGVLSRQCLKLVHQSDQRFIEPQAIPDEANPHALIHQILGLTQYVTLEQAH